jgi:cell division protein FtsL
MQYGGTEAFRLGNEVSGRTWQDTPLVPLEGGRLDAVARSGVSAGLQSIVACVVALAISLFVVGGISVALTSGTVAMLRDNAAISSEIKAVRTTNDDLRIECSLLSRADRISRIATQNLGMVYASEAEVLDLE